MSVELKLSPPYVGPSAFREGDVLYGRDAEALDLCDQLIASRIVLLTSPSGAGKTSLIQARIVPYMRNEGFRVYPLIRVGAAPQWVTGLDTTTANRYVTCTINCLEQDDGISAPGSNGQHADLELSNYLDVRNAGEGAQRELLIFDQFEEILTVDPTDREAKREFFRQLAAVLRKPHRWGLFAIREDYAAALEPYTRRVPTGLKTTFHLDLLGPDEARRAIQEPAKWVDVTITDASANRLVDELRQVRVQHPDASVTDEQGLYVEPVQLQIACLRVWHLVNPEAGARIELDSLPPRSIVDDALAEYYATQVGAVAARTNIGERKIRDWIQNYLITPQDIRGQVPLGPKLTQGLENAAVKGLENAYILRADRRGSGIWYELAHDRLVPPIQQNNAQWFSTHLNILQQQAAVWDRTGRDRGLLLGGTALDEQSELAVQHPDEFSDVEWQYLRESQRAREEAERRHRTTRLIQRLLWVALVLLVIAVSAAGVAYVQREQADQARAAAVAAQTTAEEAKVLADHAREIAEEQGRNAQSGELAAQALARRSDNPDLSVLLAIAAADTAETDQAYMSLQESLRASNGTLMLRDPAQPDPTQPVNQLAVSADGSTLATASSDRLARIWEMPSGQLRVVLAGHTDRVVSIGFSRDGARIVTGSADTTARIWDAHTGALLKVLVGHTKNVLDAVFSPDGTRVATASDDKTVRLWDTQTGSAQAVMTDHTAVVRHVSFSADGNMLVSSSDDMTARVWDGHSGDLLNTLVGHTGPVVTAAISRDGDKVVTSSYDNTARIWDARSRAEPKVLKHDQGVVNAVFSPDGTRIVTGSWDNSARVWDADSGTLLHELRGHTGPVEFVSFSRDGTRLLTGSRQDSSVRLWETETGTPMTVLRGPNAELTGAAFGADAARVATSYSDGNPRLWTAADISAEQIQRPSQNAILQSAAVNEQGTRIVVGAANGTIRVVEAGTGRLVVEYPEQTSPVLSVAFSSDGNRIIAGSYDGLARVLSSTHREAFQVLATNGGQVIDATLSRDAALAVTATSDGGARVWDLRQCQRICDRPRAQLVAVEGKLKRAIFTPDASKVLTVDSDGMVAEWDWLAEPESRVIASLGMHVLSAAFTSDATRVAGGGIDGTTNTWDLAAQRPLVTLGDQGAPVAAVAFSHDGRFVATGTGLVGSVTPDYAVRIWDTHGGRQVAELPSQKHQVTHVEFSPDDALVLTTNADAAGLLNLYAWQLYQPFAELRSLAKDSATRALTDVERHQYPHAP
jgi:WD40 repeat protein